jgi:hypothetical protein
VKLGALDLNLLVVFDAVMQERNVTRAGQRLGLSQPAMNHALTRLRHMLKDDLFVRSPKGMLPTPRAEQLALPIRTALDGLQLSLEPTQFVPSKATRSFRVAVEVRSTSPTCSIAASWIWRSALSPEQGERFSRLSLLEGDFVLVLRKVIPQQGTASCRRTICCAIASLNLICRL